MDASFYRTNQKHYEKKKLYYLNQKHGSCFGFALAGQNQLPSPEEARKIKLKPKTWPKVDSVVAKISVTSLEEKKAAARGKIRQEEEFYTVAV